MTKATTKTHSYKQFLASVLYNSKETPNEIKEDLLEKYGEIIKIS